MFYKVMSYTSTKLYIFFTKTIQTKVFSYTHVMSCLTCTEYCNCALVYNVWGCAFVACMYGWMDGTSAQSFCGLLMDVNC